MSARARRRLQAAGAGTSDEGRRRVDGAPAASGEHSLTAEAYARPAGARSSSDDLRPPAEHAIDPSLDRIRALVNAAGRPAAGVPGHPPDRDQRQDVDGPDDRVAAARPRPADRPVHQPAPVLDPRADLRRRRSRCRPSSSSTAYDEIKPYLDLVDQSHEVPAVLLRGAGRHGVRGVRRRPGGRVRDRGRHGRHLGQHQRRRRRRGGRHARSPSTTPRYLGSTVAEIAAEKAGHHQARRRRRARASSRRRRPRSCCAGRPRSAPRSPARAWNSGCSRASWPSAASRSPSAACSATTTDLFLPLFGAHQAGNLACAIAAVEAFARTPARPTGEPGRWTWPSSGRRSPR